MKSKSSLPLMEQLIMVLVFALAASLCLQGFSLAHRLSLRQQARNHAAAQVQTAAESLKHFQGDYSQVAHQLNGIWDGQCMQILYDESWTPCQQENAAYQLLVCPAESSHPNLSEATVEMFQEKVCLFSISVCWQTPNDSLEVNSYE